MRFHNLLVLSIVLAASPAMHSQTSPSWLPNPTVNQKPAPGDEARLKMERDMAKRANLERQADLKRDTDKLLKLANELKESVDKTTEGTLSLDVVKKAEEIEKLARSVKGKMKGPY